jgi:hypothetical protein
MTFRSLRLLAPATGMAFVVAACASPTSAVSTAPNVPALLRAGSSHMAPDAKSQALLYVSSVLTNDVYVFAYPKGTPEGTLTGFNVPYGLCSDAAGNVFIVNDGASQIVEYAHGGTTPIATLSDPGEFPEGCAVDPVTGNLAVANFYSTSGSGSVAIYVGATGTPTLYTDPDLAQYRFCGYDNKGNLFVDGVNSGSVFTLAELPHGKNSLSTIPFKQTIEWPGGVQFDGKDLAIGDTDLVKVYRTSGKSGKVRGTVNLDGAKYVNQFWIVPAGGKSNVMQASIIAPSQDGNVVGIYPYPAGSSLKKTIGVQEPFGATVSNI